LLRSKRAERDRAATQLLEKEALSRSEVRELAGSGPAAPD
jgi:hypothetical protein